MNIRDEIIQAYHDGLKEMNGTLLGIHVTADMKQEGNVLEVNFHISRMAEIEGRVFIEINEKHGDILESI